MSEATTTTERSSQRGWGSYRGCSHGRGHHEHRQIPPREDEALTEDASMTGHHDHREIPPREVNVLTEHTAMAESTRTTETPPRKAEVLTEDTAMSEATSTTETDRPLRERSRFLQMMQPWQRLHRQTPPSEATREEAKITDISRHSELTHNCYIHTWIVPMLLVMFLQSFLFSALCLFDKHWSLFFPWTQMVLNSQWTQSDYWFPRFPVIQWTTEQKLLHQVVYFISHHRPGKYYVQESNLET